MICNFDLRASINQAGVTCPEIKLARPN